MGTGRFPHAISCTLKRFEVVVLPLQRLLPYYAAGESVEVTISYQAEGQYVDEKVTVVLGSLSEYKASMEQTE